MGPTDALFTLDSGQSFRSVAIYQNPNDDISLVQVAETMPGWYDIYWNTNQVGQQIEMVGYGLTGTLNGTTWSYSGSYGTKRRGRNVVTFTQYANFGGTPQISGDWMICDFDGNGIDLFGDGGPVTDEATLAGGDSGGASMMMDAGVWKLAGVHSWVGSAGGPEPPQWGSIFGDIRVSSYRTWYDGIVPAEVVPASFSLTRGILLSGTLSNLTRSDDMRMNLRPGIVLSSAEAPIQLVLNGTSPVLTTTELHFPVEANANQANIRQTIELFNYQTSSYEQMDSRIAATTDSLVDVIVSTNPSRFINSSTGALRARISYKAAGPVLNYPWLVGIDRAVWNIKR